MLKIGELAARSGINHRTLRYYERLGLMQPAHKAKSGHRYYTEDALDRLQRIQQLKSLGLSLDEIATVIDAYFATPKATPDMNRALAQLQNHLAQTRAQLQELRNFEQLLISSITRLEIYLDETNTTEPT